MAKMSMRPLLSVLVVAGIAAGCAVTPAGPPGASYRCEHGLDFTVRFADDSAVLDVSLRGRDVLFRDAGGQGAAQTVYSNANARAEFGLGANGREALLRYFAVPVAARCVRD